MPTEVVRVDGALLDLAKSEGATMGRSAASQLSHWARIGRAIEHSGIPSSAIHAVLARQQSFDSLDDEDQRSVAELWGHSIKERIAGLDLAAEFEVTGAAYAELDDDGNAVIVRPSKSPGASPATARADKATSGVLRQTKPGATKSGMTTTKSKNVKGGAVKSKAARTPKASRTP